jgi:deoxyribonuclease-4
MPLFGAHMSIAGGYYKAILAAQAHDCQAVQIFTKNNNQWAAKALSDEDIRLFRHNRREAGIEIAIAHDSYLINLASHDEALWRRSLEAFIVEMERAEAFGLDYLVTHPGVPVDGDELSGLARVAQALDEVHRRCPRYRVKVLLETTAGQGNSLGHRFEHLAEIIKLTRQSDRLGVCLDTCHVYAAGYALAPAKQYRATLRAFDRIIGLDRLHAFHVNDSKKTLGSRVDRHDHIGHGYLGLEAFRYLVNDRRFRGHAMILETAKEGPNDEAMDAVNLKALRALVKRAASAR